jgi:HK97 family phage prohead protease/HK97 family phage major capsid protein
MLYHRTTVTPGDGLDFVISDGSLDMHGTRINPQGWQFRNHVPALFSHDAKFPIGVWENLKMEKDRVVGSLKLAKDGTSARHDEVLSLVRQGILRAVSAGFSVEEQGKHGSDYDYERQTLMEASLVAVPSNANAVMQAREAGISDDTLKLVFGEQAEKPVRAMNGGHAATSPTKATQMDGLGPQIEAAQSGLNAARDALAVHLAEGGDDFARTDTLTGTVEARESQLQSLLKAEKALGMRAGEPIAGGEKKLPAPAIGRPSLTSKRDLRPVDGGDLVLRAIAVKFRSYVMQKDPIQVLEERYGDHEQTQIVVRAAIAGASTTTAGWAAELVQQANADFLAGLDQVSVFPGLAAKGTQLSFGPNSGSIKVPSRASTPSIAGSFVAEGGAIPVRRVGLTSITLTPTKMGVLSVFSREMAMYSNPTIEGLLRREINRDTAITIDSLLTDAVAATVGLRPAGLRNGVSAITAATGGGYAAILKDIQALAAPFDTANAGRNLVLLMAPREARALAMSPGPDGTLGWSTAFMGEFSVLTSTAITAGMLIMVDAEDFVSVSGTPEFRVSEETVLHMEDTTPLAIGTAGSPATVAAPAQSMFQTASIALRMLLEVNWAMRRTGMVQWMTGANWALA